MVMAFAGVDEVRRLYRTAVDERYRFYSLRRRDADPVTGRFDIAATDGARPRRRAPDRPRAGRDARLHAGRHEGVA